MSILDMMIGTADDEEERAAQRLVSTYFKYHAADEILGKAGEYLGGDSDEKRLHHEDMVLGIAAKKRALGLPYDDADYEEATNENRPFRTKGVVAAWGKRASNLIPEPGFLQPKTVGPYTLGHGGDRMGESILENLVKKIPYRLSTGASYDRPSVFARIFRK